ncbi:MAG: glycosyltransferase, partial [Ignavibacteriae bacterium]|nr:glycosyltransferase [Ignavibacteriota bacterium]
SFDWKTANFNTQLGETKIYKLDKSSSSLKFYLTFFYLLIRDLLKYKASIYFAEDVYTLPVVYFFAKLNKAKIFYNSREIYAHIAGLRKKSFVQKIIAKIESKFIGKVDFVLVTGEMDKEYLVESYGLNNILVLRNLPKFTEVKNKIDLREKLNIPNDQKILLYQGVILEGRGIKKVIDVLDKINNAHFVIIGEGEFRKQFESEITGNPIESRVHFIGQVNHKDLLDYTASADLGLALIENISLSYYYALPNKIFEYIMAEVPILCSDLPQMKKIVDDYSVGKYVNLDVDNLANIINEMLYNNELLNEYKQNCKQAAKELNWDFEFNKVKDLLLN